ncbi:hypothetical protein ACJJTC_007067 [Scirpophaga incertulas]
MLGCHPLCDSRRSSGSAHKKSSSDRFDGAMYTKWHVGMKLNHSKGNRRNGVKVYIYIIKYIHIYYIEAHCPHPLSRRCRAVVAQLVAPLVAQLVAPPSPVGAASG